MISLSKLSFLEKSSLVLVIALLLCLCPMPYGFYTVIRLATAIIACCWAYQFYEAKKTPLAIIAGAIAILFQPLIKIVLDRTTWNIIDILLAIAIVFLILPKFKSLYMENNYNLERFVTAQNRVIESVISELKNGKKQSHWMWFIFPQLKGLGHSYNSKFYGITDLEEAKLYLAHPILGARLKEVCTILENLPIEDPEEIFGTIDTTKLRSSMTLFDQVEPNSIFHKLLMKYYDGYQCGRTIRALNSKKNI